MLLTNKPIPNTVENVKIFCFTQSSIMIVSFLSFIVQNLSDIDNCASVIHGNSNLFPYKRHIQNPNEIISSFSSTLPIWAESDMYSGEPTANSPNLVLPFSFAIFKSERTPCENSLSRSARWIAFDLIITNSAYQKDKLRRFCGRYFRASRLVQLHRAHECTAFALSEKKKTLSCKFFFAVPGLWLVLPFEWRS